jgi:hypothetical protein
MRVARLEIKNFRGIKAIHVRHLSIAEQNVRTYASGRVLNFVPSSSLTIVPVASIVTGIIPQAAVSNYDTTGINGVASVSPWKPHVSAMFSSPAY